MEELKRLPTCVGSRFLLLVGDVVLFLFVGGEEFEVDAVGHGFHAGVGGVEVVAAVVGGEEGVGVGGVGGGVVEVDDAVEDFAGADEGVDGLAGGFAGGGHVAGAGVGGEGGADDLDAVGVGAFDELGEAGDEVVGGDDVVGLSGVEGVADVVDAFKDDEVADGGLGEDVGVEAREGGGAGAIVEDAVAADADVEDAEVGGGFVAVEAAGEEVGPALVGVGGAGGAIGDAVAEGYDGGGVVGGFDVDGLEEEPVGELLVGRRGGISRRRRCPGRCSWSGRRSRAW